MLQMWRRIPMEAVLQSPLGQTVLGPGVLTIGRALDNQLVVNNPTASSHHAEIRPGVQSYSLTDLGRPNATFVNEQKLNPLIPRLLQAGATNLNPSPIFP